MWTTIVRCFQVPELRNRILFTFAMLAVYRVGFAIPIPGIDQVSLQGTATNNETTPLGQIAQTFSMFSGGSFEQSTIFGLGIMPYISASIIFQLLATVVPELQKLQKEGQIGTQKINEYTRYATVVLALIQSIVMVRYFYGSDPSTSQVFIDVWTDQYVLFWVVAVLSLTAGTVFLMWLGEQIDQYGIGNGISLIISAGIIGHMPGVIAMAYQDFTASGRSGIGQAIVLLVMFVCVVMGAIFITQAQRRIPIQQAKQVAGRRMQVGTRQYLPLRVNHGGVMPIIFASAIIIFPQLFVDWLASVTNSPFISSISTGMTGIGFFHIIVLVGMIYFFAYFWTAVQFRPRDVANQLRDYGSFIPGLRPGKRTADYLEHVMGRVTYVGAGFLCIMAIIPSIVAESMHIAYPIAAFLGGTGLLIIVSVTLDFVQRVEAQLAMRNYGTFLDPEGGQRMRGAYGG